jgi:hypothetical protein
MKTDTTAFPVPKAFVPIPVTTPDGVRWLEVAACSDIYSHYKRMADVVKFGDRFYRKVSYNSDSFLIHYREVPESAIAINS